MLKLKLALKSSTMNLRDMEYLTKLKCAQGGRGLISYTFRTNKNIVQFIEAAGLGSGAEVFIINKPSQDLPKLLSLISQKQPDWVIGFASTVRDSRWEVAALNSFGKGRVSDAAEMGSALKLSKPDFLGELSEIPKAPLSSKMSASFCNQAAYRVAEQIKLSGANCRAGFLHLRNRL